MDEVMVGVPIQTREAHTPSSNIGKRLSARLQSGPRALSEITDHPSSKTPRTPSSRMSPPLPIDDTPITQRGLRKRKIVETKTPSDSIEDALKPLTAEERLDWKGWIEIESDPTLFDFILRQYGVSNVKVQELFSLDDFSLAELPHPVYGLVFLFKYRDNDAKEDEHTPKCPGHVWFANQTTNNACGTVALMNIVMNVPGVELGETLDSFKESTRALSPPHRGQRLSKNNFIRNIHNTFARRIDLLNADLSLDNDFDKWKRAKRAPKRKYTPKKKADATDDDELGHHFVAYVPINDEVWRLDGLQHQPINLGTNGGNWTAIARDNIMSRIEEYSSNDDMDYVLIALCKSPLRTIQDSLASNMHSILAIEEALTETIPDWKVFSEAPESMSFHEFQGSFGLSAECIGDEKHCKEAENWVKKAGGEPAKLLEIHSGLVREQKGLRSKHIREMMAVCQEDEVTLKKKQDHVGGIYKVIEMLAEAGVLNHIVKEIS